MIHSNNVIMFTAAYGLCRTAKPLRDLASAYRWRYFRHRDSQVMLASR